jgi:ribosomal protein S18 acetylase RimI-like enzyme
MNRDFDIHYRPANPEDSGLCYAIKTRSIKPYVTAVYGWDEDFQQAFHQKTFNPDSTRILSLKDPVPGQPLELGVNRVFGYIEMEYRETEIFLANILIDQAFQGRGLGGAVMRELIRPGTPVRLEVFRVNTRARKFYERLGFRITSRDPIKYVMVSSNFRKG